jgi:hypothetical protein
MITATDFVEISTGQAWPKIRGATHRACYYRDGRRYGVVFASPRPEYDLRKVATEVGTIVKYMAERPSPDWGMWHVAEPTPAF